LENKLRCCCEYAEAKRKIHAVRGWGFHTTEEFERKGNHRTTPDPVFLKFDASGADIFQKLVEVFDWMEDEGPVTVDQFSR
jgi:hypothetical protein